MEKSGNCETLISENQIPISILLIPFTRIQITQPKNVGSRNDASVHFRLPVSFFMVISVVAQGQCSREKSMVHSAVTGVQPFAVSMACMDVRFPVSTRLPAER